MSSVATVVLDYTELNSPSKVTIAKVRDAFGSASSGALGILAVKNVPNFVRLRAELLPLVWKFGRLPHNVRKKYEVAESFFSVGWSHGKESMAKDKPDFSKGSYYFNPLHDVPTEDAALIKKHPEIFFPNVWPKEDLPDLENAGKALSSTIVEVGRKIARICDVLIASEVKEYQPNRLFKTLEESPNCKARLLHYFPLDENNESDWCGWHNDHSTLTGLVPAMYLKSDGTLADAPAECGLYIRSRSGTVSKVNLPLDYLAFQIGESAQIHSGGVLQATPHYVKAPKMENSGITRVTMAVFMEPTAGHTMDIPEGISVETFTDFFKKQSLPPGVPKLTDRWDNGIDFSEFSSRTINAYYS